MLGNIVILVHLAFFVFVLGGFIATVIGVLREEPWVLTPWFRFLHLGAVLLVVIEDSLTIDCPLNVFENHLRDPVATPGFLEYLLHHTIPEQTLDILYLTMVTILLVLIFTARPRFHRK